MLLPVTSQGVVTPSRDHRIPTDAPLRFTFVDVPDDQAVPESPRASLFSDRTRIARQPVPTPADANRLGPVPHAEGNSDERQLPRSGPPRPSHPVPRPVRRPGDQQTGGKARGMGMDEAEEGETAPKTNPPGETEEGGVDDGEGSRANDRRASFQKALEQLQSGTYDFGSYDNPSYLRNGTYGTLSFDTKGFDWGDYARQLYLIIKKNWYDRIPIAAWYGQKGKVFVRFVIEKDGAITDLAVIRSSDIAPFDLAAENAIRASNPLPPLPGNFPKEREGVTFGFYYNLPIDQP